MPKSFALSPDPSFENAAGFPFGTKTLDQRGISRLSAVEALAIRALDMLVSLIALVALAPLLVLVCLLITLRNPGPVFFVQRRMGRDGRTFRCFKFRTMVVDAEHRLAELLANDPVARAEWALDHKLRNDPRIIAGGDLLRKSSLDELPQLLNVLRGDMSIVGPRPIVESEIVRYGRYYDHYCAVRPGLTGLWQISGRNDVSYRRRVACDISYARSKSLRTDLRIMFMTVPAVLMAKGSY
jgi:lipopolysaccharide/colanic/teichoic acid biosynthesis glycosyltransferase